MKKCILWGNWVSKRSRRDPDHEKTFLTFTLSVNKIILYQFSMFKSLDSIASVVGVFMYLTISKLKQVLRSRKGLGKVSTTTLMQTAHWLLSFSFQAHLLWRVWPTSRWHTHNQQQPRRMVSWSYVGASLVRCGGEFSIFLRIWFFL